MVLLESLAVATFAGAVAAAVTIGALRSDMKTVKENLHGIAKHVNSLTVRVGMLEVRRRA